MTTPRWSTITLLSIVALAAMLGFYFGTALHRAPQSATLPAGLQNPIAMETTAPLSIPATNATPPENFEAIVKDLLAQPATPARDAALLAALGQLAMHDPLRAIAIARAETNPRLRSQLLEASFTGWGKTDPNTAADWILAQPAGSLDTGTAITALLKGAVQNPDVAVQLTQRLNQANPDQARDTGDALIYALGQNGGFQRAADFAAAASGDLRTEWLAAAYGNWSNFQPQNAAASAMQISDADVRTSAIDAVIPGWQQTDPKGLADFSMNNLSDGDQKTRALTAALASWAGNNAGDAATWLNQFGPAPEFDQGEAAIATQQQVMQQPDLALSWAQNITDPNLRSRTISAIVETWTLSNPSAALNFAQTTGDLQPDDRNSLLAKLGGTQN
jgi:hypothetical protein